MKTMRIWLLLLLAVLLPVRGAVAAAMLCPVAGSAGMVELRLDASAGSHGHLEMHEGKHAPHAAPHPAAAEHDPAGAPAHHGGGVAAGASDACNLCAAFCSLTPLVSTAPALPHFDAANATFPAYTVPAPRFVSDGQERPPRST